MWLPDLCRGVHGCEPPLTGQRPAPAYPNKAQTQLLWASAVRSGEDGGSSRPLDNARAVPV